MTKRIARISSYIEDDEKVIDVGCDSCLLSIMLAKRGIYSVASDLRENIIENAKEKIDDNLKKYITFRVGDGITLKESENNYTLVLAGMGTYLMVNILKNTTKTFKKIITISNNNHDILRKEFLHLGYIVETEEIIKEKNKFYNLIIFTRGNKKYSEKDLIIGLNHQNIPLLKEKNKELIKKYQNIINKINDSEKIKELERTIKILESSI